MTAYAIFFNQQWVGEHAEEWFRSRGPTSRAVIDEMDAAGVLLFAGGLEEGADEVFHADGTGRAMVVTDGPYAETTEQLGGLTVIEVPDLATARMWAAKVAEGCGWPQEVRPFWPGIRTGRSAGQNPPGRMAG